MIELCDSCRVEPAVFEVVFDSLGKAPGLLLSCASQHCSDFLEVRGGEESRSGFVWTQPMPTPKRRLAVPPVPCLGDVSCL